MKIPFDILRCPISGLPLRAADAEVVNRLAEAQRGSSLRNRNGEPAEPFEGGLVTQDGTWFYPIRSGIPVLLPGEAVKL